MATPTAVPPATLAAEADAQKTRLAVFASLFKSYMGLMPMVTAALAPLLTALNVLPMYEPQRKPLATMAGVLGFLLLGWLFYVRRTIALGSITKYYRTLFNFTPLLLIGLSILSYVAYTRVLDASISGVIRDNPSSQLKRTDVLRTWTEENDAPDMVELQMLYLGMFLAAEAAFVMMAMREYANDVRGITEFQWMFGPQDGSSPVLPAQPLPSVVVPAAKAD
jgi:hypothetical protein